MCIQDVSFLSCQSQYAGPEGWEIIIGKHAKEQITLTKKLQKIQLFIKSGRLTVLIDSNFPAESSSITAEIRKKYPCLIAIFTESL